MSAKRRAVLPVALFFLLPFGAGAAWWGCAVYDSSLLLPAPPDAGGDVADVATPPPVDASDGGADVAISDGYTCTSVQPPAAPAKDDGTQDLDVVLALRNLDIGIRLDGGAPPIIGYDLDQVCTCPGPESCKAAAGAQHCDEPEGRDNSGGQLLQTFAGLSNGLLNQDSIDQHLTSGDYGLILRIQHYNGTANDTQVTASIFISDGTVPLPDGGGAPTPPNWDGNDSWTVDSQSVLGGNADAGALIPNYFDTQAYVADSTLVAKIDFPLTLGNGAGAGLVTLDLTGGFVAAKLTPVGSTFQVDTATLAGRWATSKLLGALSILHDPGDSTKFLCPGDQFYENVKALICKSADITADPGAAEGTSPCDALSIGIAFTAAPAQLGPVTSHAIAPPTCPDAGVDTCN